MSTEQTCDIQAAIDAGMAVATPRPFEVAGVPMLMIPKTATCMSLEHLLPGATRTKARVQMEDVPSFIEYFNRFANEDSAIFCDAQKGLFVGVIDYHACDKAAWADHTVTLKLTETAEWAEWRQNSGRKMNQEEFGLFIETNLEEIIQPAGAEMLEIATSLRAKNQVDFASATRLDNGQVQLEYKENIKGSAGVKGQLSIPETIKLGMRVNEGGEGYSLEARFRYRIREGQLVMWYDLIRPHKVQRAAFDEATDRIKEQAKSALFVNGSPNL